MSLCVVNKGSSFLVTCDTLIGIFGNSIDILTTFLHLFYHTGSFSIFLRYLSLLLCDSWFSVFVSVFVVDCLESWVNDSVRLECTEGYVDHPQNHHDAGAQVFRTFSSSELCFSKESKVPADGEDDDSGDGEDAVEGNAEPKGVSLHHETTVRTGKCIGGTRILNLPIYGGHEPRQP